MNLAYSGSTLQKMKNASSFLQYVDDSLIAGTKEAIRQLHHKLNKHFKCKYQKPKDFLGMDIEHKTLGEITLSMNTFTEKLQQAFDLKDNVWGGLNTRSNR